MGSSSQPATGVLGSLRSEGDSGLVRLEHRYDAAIDDVWSALTDPARLIAWYGVVDGDLRAGGEFRLHIPTDGYFGTGLVKECEPPHRLVVTSRETDESFHAGQGAAPFDDLVEVVLTRDGDATRLVAEISGLPLDKIPYFGVGWQIHAERLGTHLAGKPCGSTEQRWEALIPAYLELAARLD